MTEAGTGHAT